MNKKETTASYYDPFNARSLRPEEVASRFVPSDAFGRLVRKGHSIVVGPRGSGKTTLLKMLQQPALEAWSHPEAQSYRDSIDYTGVFIATDVNWQEQVNSLSGVDFSEDEQRLFSGAAFTTHILHSLVMAFLYRTQANDSGVPFRRVDLPTERETYLVREIASGWDLVPALPTLISLKHAVSKRLTRLREFASSERLADSAGRSARLQNERFLHTGFLEATVGAIEIFDDVVGESNSKWALLFDELELAPKWIREKLISSTRSVYDQLLFKLSISTYDDQIRTNSLLGPMQDNDYEAIALWYASREDGYSFCDSLWQQMLVHRGIEDSNAEKMLGPSIFDLPESSKSKSAYGPRSAHNKRFRDLAADDASFAKYLEEKKIDIDSLNTGSENDRAADVRKMIAVVAARHTYRVPDNAKRRQKVRGRKNPKLFVGAKSLFAMVEANPRLLIAVGSRLLDSVDSNNKIPANAQNREITKAANRFHAILETIPCLTSRNVPGARSVEDLVSNIGEYFFKTVVLDEFNPEPPGSFTVDQNIDPAVCELLGQALNIGALVYVPDEPGSVLIGDLTNKRFRLCYLLAAIYRFPIRLGRSISLSHILREMAPADESVEDPVARQQDLFGSDGTDGGNRK